MEINTEFSINETVILIQNKHEQYFETCDACSGRGNITLDNNKPRVCPECYGRKGYSRNKPTKWMISQALTIGKIIAEIVNIEKTDVFDNIGEFKEGNTERKTQYMAYETGVGSGTLWPEGDLFSSRGEAQTECDKRNSHEKAGD